MKSYPWTKLVRSRLALIVEKAAQGLAEVVTATGTQVSDVVLHVWYYGEPVVYTVEELHAYGEQYRSHFTAAVKEMLASQEQAPMGKKRGRPKAAAGGTVMDGVGSLPETGAPRATVKLHQYQEVLDIVHPEFRTHLLQRVPVSWTA